MKSLKIIVITTLASLVLAACTTRTGNTPQTPAGQPPAAQPENPPAADGGQAGAEILLPPTIGIADRPDVRAFMAEMSREHGLGMARMQDAFSNTGIHPGILDAIAKPYEAKPWYAYRKLFLTEKRIQGGLEFMRENREALVNARARYGVSPAIITAIIGIESAYGARPGKYRLMDSLATLAFEHPRRGAFFRSELEQFLLLCRDEGLDYLQPTGSYAGAMGMPQFMPSSYRKLAADGDGDGRRDIWKNPADAIASVANYFAKNGWRTGEPIASPASVRGTGYQQLVSTKTPKPAHTLAYLKEKGISPETRIGGDYKAGLLQLEGESGPDYWVTFQNFNVIMRYNHSPLYAMAAYELTRAFAESGNTDR